MLKTKWAALLAGMALAGTAHANLLVNGGFEDNHVSAGGWNYFSSANVNGWDGSNIEIWNNLNGVSAAEGINHAELNAHPYTGGVFSIFQNVATVVGQSYDVSFFYRARASNNESFHFSVGTLSTLLTDHVVNQWSIFSNSFVATTNMTELRFTSSDTSTVGNFIDGVAMSSRVPESNSIALFLVGLLGLGVARRKSLI